MQEGIWDVFFTGCSIKCENLGDGLRTSKASRDIPSFSSPFKTRSDVIRHTDVTNTCPAHWEWAQRMFQCRTVMMSNLSSTELHYAMLEHTRWIRQSEDVVVCVRTRLPGGRSTESCLCLLPRILFTSLFRRPSTPALGPIQSRTEWQKGPFLVWYRGREFSWLHTSIADVGNNWSSPPEPLPHVCFHKYTRQLYLFLHLRQYRHRSVCYRNDVGDQLVELGLDEHKILREIWCSEIGVVEVPGLLRCYIVLTGEFLLLHGHAV